jgi:hypothetical protein
LKDKLPAERLNNMAKLPAGAGYRTAKKIGDYQIFV